MQRRTLLSRLASLPALAALAAGARAAEPNKSLKIMFKSACGACSRARGVSEQDLTQWGAKFGNPTIFVGLVEWAERIITE